MYLLETAFLTVFPLLLIWLMSPMVISQLLATFPLSVRPHHQMFS